MLLTSWQHAYVNKLRLYPEKTCWPSLATERASTRARIADLGDPVEVRRQIPRSVRNRRAEIYQFPVSAGAEVSLNSTGKGRHITEMELGDADGQKAYSRSTVPP